MRKILIIGNNNNGNNVSDGGRIKIRLFFNLLKREGFDVSVADLYKWKLKIIKLISKIKKAIKESSTIVIMAGPNGCRPIIKLVNRLNKKKKARVVFCPLGIGAIDKLLQKRTPDEVSNFISGNDFLGIKDDKFGKELSLLHRIILQNDVLCATYKKFYNLDNTCVLENFRDVEITGKTYNVSNNFRIAYIARVTENKGIFDLIYAVKLFNQSNSHKIFLDIYGENQLSKEQQDCFNKQLSDEIKYHGEIFGTDMISLLKQYDLFCLPTKYHGEGTSGSMIESMIAGTPVLVSSYSQSTHLIKDGFTGFIYEIGNVESLYEKITYIINNRDLLEKIGKNAQEEAQKYTYKANKQIFINYLSGE